MAAGFWCQLRDIVATWWRVDRIRVSLREGRLLRLGPPCYLEHDGELWLVESRVVGAGTIGSYVTYRCSTEGRQALLTVTPTRAGREQVQWIVNGSRQVVGADDFEVYGAGSAADIRDGIPGVESRS